MPSYILYRADGDGSNIKQLSFNEANEWDPAVLNDGRIVYTRWEYNDRGQILAGAVVVVRAWAGR